MTTIGKLLSVDVYPAGSAVSEEPTVAGRLPVYEVWDFPADGGFVTIGGDVYGYESIDPDTSELVGPSLPAAAAIDTPVLLEPPAETRYGSVDLGDEGDMLQALIPHTLSALLEEGQREPDNAETVTLVQPQQGVWEIADVLDRRAELTAEAGENITPDPSDGFPPSESPDATVIGGLGALFVKWQAILNADPVTYQVHISTTSEFTPDETTLATETGATSTTIRALPDGSAVLYGTDYHVVIVATDADGAGPVGVQATGRPVQITSPDIAAEFIYGGTIIADQIIGGTLAVDVALTGTLRTAESGARVELGPFGLVAYNSLGEPASLIGSDGNSTFKGDVQARTLTVTDGMSIRGGVNEVAVAARLNLAAGISASPTPPTVVPGYTTAPTFLDGSGVSYASQGYVFKSVQRFGTQWDVAMTTPGGGTWSLKRFNADGTYAGQSFQSLSGGGPYHSGVDGFGDGAAYAMGADGRIYRTFDPSVKFLDWDMTAAPPGVTTTGDVTYSGGQARFRATPGVDARIYTPDEDAFNLRGSALVMEVDFPAVSSSSQKFRLRLDADTSYPRYYAEVAIRTEASGVRRLYLIAQDTVGIGLPVVEQYVSYDRTSMRWLRLTESNGALRLETSPTGSLWTTRITHTTTPVPATAWDSVGIYMAAEGAGGNLDVYVGSLSVGWGASDFGPTFTRVDTTNPPALGKDSTFLLIAEQRASDKAILIKQLNPRAPGIVVNTFATGATALDFLLPLVTVNYGNFDLGVARFLISTGGSANQYALAFSLSGSTLTYDANRSFRIPGLAGTAYDGTRFWTLNTDGVLSGHSTITWTDTTAFTKTWYAATTWYDGDATGGTHETSPSPKTAFSLRKRQYYTVTSADIPDEGGADDPDRIRIYLASSAATTPYLQATTAEGVNSAQLGTAVFSGTAAPASSNFPAAIGAKITNDAGTLEINGEGDVKAARFPTLLGGSAAVLAEPYLATMGIYRSFTTGGGTLTADAGGIAWSRRFLTMGGGRHATYIPGGYFQIEMPPDGTVIPSYNTAEASQTVASGRIPLGSWRTLFYEIPFKGSQTSDASRFKLVGYDTAGDFITPWNWLPIVTRNMDSENAHLGNFRWINGRLTSLDFQALVQVNGPTTDYDTTTAIADVPQLTTTVVCPGTAAVYKVTVDLAVGAAGNSNFTAYLNVNGVDDAKVIRFVQSASGNRAQQSRSWRVTGLAAGSRIFKVRAQSVVAAGHRLYAGQCSLMVQQERGW